MPLSRCAVLAVSALALGACASSSAPPKAAPAAHASAASPGPKPPEPPALPPGRLARADIDRVLTGQGPQWVLRRVMTEEVMRHDGKFAGWRLVGLPEEWRGVDLRPGDVVSRVNGLPLETPDQFFEAWKSMAKALELKIDLTRDDVARVVILPIDGAPTADTSLAMERGPGQRRGPAPQPASRSVVLGGPAPEGSEDDAY
jgi:hypothetical protein